MQLTRCPESQTNWRKSFCTVNAFPTLPVTAALRATKPPTRLTNHNQPACSPLPVRSLSQRSLIGLSHSNFFFRVRDVPSRPLLSLRLRRPSPSPSLLRRSFPPPPSTSLPPNPLSLPLRDIPAVLCLASRVRFVPPPASGVRRVRLGSLGSVCPPIPTLDNGLPNPVIRLPCSKIPGDNGRGKQVLAAADDTEGPSLSVSPASPASHPPVEHSKLRDDSLLQAVPVITRATTPASSSVLAVGSPGQRPSRASTPQQAALPELPKYPGAWDSLSSSPEYRKAESNASAYFTAVWGSPYATPSPRRPSWTLSQQTSAETSPTSLRRGRNRVPGPRQSDSLRTASASGQFQRRVFSSLGRSSGRDLLGRQGGRSIREFTEDWIIQYLSGQPRTERTNWLSDDSSSEAPSFITARNHFADDPSDGWLGLDDEPQDEDLLRTPTLASFLAQRKRAVDSESDKPTRSRHKHASTQSTDTLKQEDFWGFAYGNERRSPSMTDPKEKEAPPTPAEGESNSSAPNHAVSTTGISPIDKPLPPPPPTENGPEPTAQQSSTPASPKAAKRPATVVTNGTTQRTKKRIVWRGKACIISVPVEDKRGSEEAGYRLLTQADIEQRLQKWIDEGYDIRGFDVYAPEEDAVPADCGGLSRLPYPDPAECQQEWKERKYAISFPNQAEWDAYVNFLKEEKLRALGVSMGDEDPPANMSPNPMAALNAALAGYPGLIASPPVPTSSAASNPLLGVHPFSPHFNQSTNPSTNVGSLASPAPQFGGQHPFFGVDSNMVAGLSYPFQPTPPVAGTFTPQSLFNARQAGAVSAGPGNLPNLNSLLSPVSPLNAEDSNTFHQGGNDMLAPRRDSIRGQETNQQSRKSRAATLVAEAQPEPEHYQTSNVEIAQPTPRGHSHNVSETLQKGLDRYSQADYHLEESIHRQLEENDREPTTSLMKSRWAVPENEVQSSQFPKDSFSQGHHRLFGEQQQAAAAQDADEIDTNPSLEGTRDQEQDLSHHPWHSAKPSTGSFVGGHHKSRTSMSTLNVEAKEFDPTSSSLSSNTFTFHGSSFQPGSFDSPSTIFSPSSAVFKPGGFNATAPAFTPFGSQATSFSPNGFTFSTSSFNVDAPEFNPGQSVTANGKSDAPDHLKSRIFGDIDFSQISKPSKKSKAIPIVRPDDAERERKKQKDEEVDNSASGPQPRQKRARHGAEDGDKDAEIATSALPVGEAAQPQASAAPSQSHKQVDGKENAAPEDSAADTSADAKPAVADIKPVPPPKDVTATEKAVSESVEVEKVEKVDKAEQAEQPEQPVAPVSEAGSKEQPSQDTSGKEDAAKEKPEQVTQTKGEPAAPAPAPEPEPAAATEPVSEPAPEPRKPEPKKTKTFSFRPSIAEFVPAAFSAFRKKEQPARPKEEPEKPKEEPVQPKPADISPPVETNHVKPELPQLPEEPAPKTDSAPTQGTPRRQVDPDSPDEQELNAVMEQLNGDDPNIGVERVSTPVRPQEPVETPGAPSTGPPIPPQLRSDAPSPSPRRGLHELLHTVPKLGTDFDVQSQVAVSQRGLASGAQSPIRQLISNDNHISDWDDVIESGEDEKLVQRSKFFDRHINELVGNVLEERLGPLEETLNVIQQSVTSLSSRSASRRPLRSASAEVEDSDADADDEDDEEVRRPISPFSKKDRKLEKLKNAVVEALVAHQKESQPPAPAVDLAPIHESIAELKALAASRSSPDQGAEIKNLIQETLATQLKNTILRRLTDAEEIGAESLKLQVDGLKSMLRIADERAEQEYKARRDAQDALAEAQKLLKIAEEDAARHRQAAQDAEENLRQLREEKIPHFEKIQNRSDALEKQQQALELTLSELSKKNIALEGTLDEYRESQENWKRQVAEVQNENKELRANVNHLKTRIEDSMRARQSLRGKFDRLQDDMVSATRDIARQQAAWRKKEEELNAKYDALRAAYDREVKLREKLEMDIAELEQQEREAAKLKFIFGQSQQENARLEELVAALRQESHEYQSKAARFEREFNEARESSRIEVQRTRTAMEADVEAANNQVNYVRAELEAQIARLESQLENVRLEADTMKERYELLLEEARDAKANAVVEITAAKDNALEEQRKRHESVLNDLRERHARALHNASEDRQRTESYLTDRLNLANEKIEHLQDRVTHLEEKLEIAKSAARAAAQAAQAKGAAASAPMDHHTTSPSMSFRKDSLVPEKISPQALRESILVLQDQLQQRETRIEELEQQLSEVDHDAPNKLKEKDTEINWLRELLEVRVGDLQDLIDTLSRPSFDQQAVRDAAIRLKANLEMEKQEKERAMAGGKTFPSLASLAAAASPRSLPLAAAAAWGSWRKGRESFTSEVSQTPSKSTNGGFLSGLLTPPSSNVRQTPRSVPGGRHSRPLRQTRQLSARQAEKMPAEEPEPPTTPPLLRRSSYDHDAEPNSYDHSVLMDDDSVGGVPESPKGTKGLFAQE